MLPIADSGLGGNICFPDPCLTPPTGAPIPYVNLSQNAMSMPPALKTFATCKNVQNLGSTTPMTLGDQAGVMGPFMGSGMNTMGSPKVFVEGLPATHLCCSAIGNNGIAGLGLKAIPSINNVLVTHAGAPRTGEVSAAEVAGLARALAASPDDAEGWIDAAVYLRVSVFSAGLPARVHAALRRFAGAQALVLDLRRCPGGDLTAAVELAGDFLDEGATIATVVDDDGDEVVYRAQHEQPCRIPLVLLVDRDTASAAEVFAGALKAHGRAAVIGERTHGKGTAQQVVPGDGARGAQYVTVATVVLPDGERLHGRGVQPDVLVPTSSPPPIAADFASPDAVAARLAVDPALAAALATSAR